MFVNRLDIPIKLEFTQPDQQEFADKDGHIPDIIKESQAFLRKKKSQRLTLPRRQHFSKDNLEKFNYVIPQDDIKKIVKVNENEKIQSLLTDDFFDWKHKDFVFKYRIVLESDKIKKEEDFGYPEEKVLESEEKVFSDYNIKRNAYPFYYFREFNKKPQHGTHISL